MFCFRFLFFRKKTTLQLKLFKIREVRGKVEEEMLPDWELVSKKKEICNMEV